jgi:hypothetical protein
MRLAFAIMLIAALGGCATITRGTTSKVSFASTPEGAEVRTSMGQTCITPCTMTFSRKDEFQAIFSKAGFETQTVQVRSQFAGEGAAGLAGNVVFGGIIGVGVDAASGATLEHVPNPVMVTLSPVRAGS